MTSPLSAEEREELRRGWPVPDDWADRLLDERDALERALDQEQHDHHTTNVARVALAAEVSRLRNWLRHRDSCHIQDGDPGLCTCGLVQEMTAHG